jgi:uncharacterized RDD family membrane protein YckC
MSEEFDKAGVLVRTISKILDIILIAAIMEILPKSGFYAGLVYFLIGDGLFGGSSIGKRLLNIKVLSNKTGMPCNFKESILRNSILGFGLLFCKIGWIGWIVFFIILSFEFIILVGSEEKMRIGDEIAGTIVVEKKTIG